VVLAHGVEILAPDAPIGNRMNINHLPLFEYSAATAKTAAILEAPPASANVRRA
jgi:hypothetical protein